MIDSVLIANRGEIAVRIIATCRRLGVRAIAIYSDADAHAAHVAEADEAYRVGASPAADSYLNAQAILAVAARAHAAALHPGYGFLSENPDFAQAVIDAGLIWIGPPPGAMRTLGDKARAKALAERHGVPVLPGYHGDDQSPQVLRAAAEKIGYPLLIKASAGGGGRGMRVVESSAEFDDALEAAQRESLASFGVQRVLLERYLRRPRHVEIQIFGDQHGRLIHLGERECSIQRRHQKLVEESPSPAVDADLRSSMGEAALRLARAAGYANAGTVEFLLDEQKRFAFLEVNARLQVEHPVTEKVTGLDLVELQLRVASDEPLPLAQDEVRFTGHAIEARVIAEDSLSRFLPSSGSIAHVEFPPGVRVDTWVRDGTEVSPHYDSLLAKIIAHASGRAASAQQLASALRETWIDGITDNVDLLLATVEHPAFLSGDLYTGFLEEHRLIESVAELPSPVMAAASSVDALTGADDADDVDPWRALSAWRIGRVDQPAAWARAGRVHNARVSAALDGDGVEVRSGSEVLSVTGLSRSDSRLIVAVDGQGVALWDHVERRVVEWHQRSFRLRAPRPLTIDQTAHDRGATAGQGRLAAPMPARVVKIAVSEGDHVSQNQPLVVLEAMKMEHVVEAPHAGVVTQVSVEVGAQVRSGTQLLTVE